MRPSGTCSTYVRDWVRCEGLHFEVIPPLLLLTMRCGSGGRSRRVRTVLFHEIARRRHRVRLLKCVSHPPSLCPRLLFHCRDNSRTVCVNVCIRRRDAHGAARSASCDACLGDPVVCGTAARAAIDRFLFDFACCRGQVVEAAIKKDRPSLIDAPAASA